MTYRTLTTFLHNAATPMSTLECAIDMARRLDAHLSVLIAGVAPSDIGYSYMSGAATAMVASLEDADNDAKKLQTQVRDRLAPEDIRWNDATATMQSGGLANFIAAQARFSDLVILPQPYGQDRTADDAAAVEAALFEARAPVLIAPNNCTTLPASKNVLVAWDQSFEALHAVRAAMPIITAAATTNITIIDPPRQGPERSDPGGQLAEMIVRHGGKPEIAVLGKTDGNISDILMRHALEQDCDMIVMGGYGHSRLRQSIFGGTTRRILEQAKIPVLMAH